MGKSTPLKYLERDGTKEWFNWIRDERNTINLTG